MISDFFIVKSCELIILNINNISTFSIYLSNKEFVINQICITLKQIRTWILTL